MVATGRSLERERTWRRIQTGLTATGKRKRTQPRVRHWQKLQRAVWSVRKRPMPGLRASAPITRSPCQNRANRMVPFQQKGNADAWAIALVKASRQEIMMPRDRHRCPTHPGNCSGWTSFLPASWRRQKLHRPLAYPVRISTRSWRPELAEQLGQLLGNGPDLWIRMQAAHPGIP